LATNPLAQQGCGWAGTAQQFLATSHPTIINALQTHAIALFPKNSSSQQQQIVAWTNQLSVLTQVLTALVATNSAAQQWVIVLEYELPQQGGRRPDVVVLAGAAVIVLEFKQKSRPGPGDIDQIRDYVCDLNDYHSVTQQSGIAATGALVLTKAPAPSKDGRWDLLDVNSVPAFLAQNAKVTTTTSQISCSTWLAAAYQPAPSLISAAVTNFLTNPPPLPPHFATNIDRVEKDILRVVAQAQKDPPSTRHVIIVTGVPGSGKTFLGLKLVHNVSVPGAKRFLSGNLPLVKVLNRALKQNRQLVTHLHEFRDYFFKLQNPPTENILIFDEAQRTHDVAQVRAKTGQSNSEAHMLLDITSRTPGWGVLILLAGPGQEIHAGEVGLTLYFDELTVAFPNINWKVHYSFGHITFRNPTPPALPANVSRQNGEFHLDDALRQHAATEVVEWVDHVLTGNSLKAQQAASKLRRLARSRFDLRVTRNLQKAKVKMTGRYNNDPSARFGLLAVSQNERYLKRYGVVCFQAFRNSRNVPVDDIAAWYLDPVSMRTSCGNLRKAASEFQCQGLDLNSTIVCWADDLAWNRVSRAWNIKPVIGVPNPIQFRLNKYRVLLTRARDGMTIFVPPDKSLDDTYKFLVACGAVPL